MIELYYHISFSSIITGCVITISIFQVITGDGAIIEVGADVYYRIENPEKSITNIQNLDKSTRILVQTSLLNLLVRLPLSKIDGHRNTITENVQVIYNTQNLNIL